MIYLLYGEEEACEGMRAALDALGPGFRCEVWTIPNATDGIKRDVLDHGGRAWHCARSAPDRVHIHCPEIRGFPHAGTFAELVDMAR